jgi:hypothetical protein
MQVGCMFDSGDADAVSLKPLILTCAILPAPLTGYPRLCVRSVVVLVLPAGSRGGENLARFWVDSPSSREGKNSSELLLIGRLHSGQRHIPRATSSLPAKANTEHQEIPATSISTSHRTT